MKTNHFRSWEYEREEKIIFHKSLNYLPPHYEEWLSAIATIRHSWPITYTIMSKIYIMVSFGEVLNFGYAFNTPPQNT